MTMPSGDILKAARKADIDESTIGRFVVRVHMKSQYLPDEQAIDSMIKEFKRHRVDYPGVSRVPVLTQK